MQTATKRLPSWAKKPLGSRAALHDMKRVLRSRGLHTVCESAKCPNIGECFSKPTATFMILGDVCTRRCGFCGVDKTRAPLRLDTHEPANIALTAKELGLKHVVLTSVTRDDVELGGAPQFALTIKALKDTISGISVEVLTPDFEGNTGAINVVLDAQPAIFNHNVETVPRLYSRVRPQADYKRSLRVLKQASTSNTITKSGIMVGLGESAEEVREVLRDLSDSGVNAVTIGQYLRPTRDNLEVVEYVHPECFKEYEGFGSDAGIEHVYSGPFVRSSYNAEKLWKSFTG